MRLFRLGLLLWACVAAGVTLADTPPASVRGVWGGAMEAAGATQPLLIVLDDREDGALLGYVLGGNHELTMTGGLLAQGRVAFELELRSPGGIEVLEVSGCLSSDEIVGSVRKGGRTSSVRLTRFPSAGLEERRVIVAELDDRGEPNDIIDFGVVRSGVGGLVAGTYSARSICGIFGCAGWVTDYREFTDAAGNPALEMEFGTGGGCRGQGSLEVTFDPAIRLYLGTYVFDDCRGSRGGPVLASGLTRTTAEHGLAVLSTYGRLADDLEEGITFSAPYAPFAADYLHRSEELQARLDELNDQVAGHDGIEVELSRFRDLHTVEDPFIFPDLPRLFGVDFHDRRSARNADGETVVYRDGNTEEGNDELRFIGSQASGWVIRGNQVSHDLPFSDYTLGRDHVVVPTTGGDIYVSLGTWGAHSPPHTGHVEGNPKADWMGQYAHHRFQMTELAGDGNGICTPGETCGVPESDLLARALDYVAPSDGFEVTEVYLERVDLPGLYYGGLEHWRVRGALAYYGFDWTHLRRIGQDLRDAMIASGYADPWTVHAPSDNLIDGTPVRLSRGQTIARPQIVATPVEGHPGYFGGGGGLGQAPWQQLEFFTRDNLSSRAESFYTWLPVDLHAGLAALHEAEGLNPSAFRYDNDALDGLDYMWRAEMALSNQEFSDGEDYSSIFTRLGGWWEGVSTCAEASEHCDELFSIFPIRDDTAFYDPRLYDSIDVAYLVIHAFLGESPFEHYGEVVQPFEPDPVAGTMMLKWRDRQGNPIGYQEVSYRLDESAEVLRVRWGAIAPTRGLAAGASLPIPQNGETCDGVRLTCHDHARDRGA